MNPKVFRKAAELIDSGYVAGACYALLLADKHSNDEYEEHLGLMSKYFQPKSATWDSHWWSLGDKEPRIIALLLCELIAKDRS